MSCKNKEIHKEINKTIKYITTVRELRNFLFRNMLNVSTEISKTIWKLQKVLFLNWVMIKNKKTCNINLHNKKML